MEGVWWDLPLRIWTLCDVWFKRAREVCSLLSARVWSPCRAPLLQVELKRWILVFESTPLYHECSKRGKRRGSWAWHLLTTDIPSLASFIWCSCGAERPSRVARHERLRLAVPVRGRPGGTGARAAPEDTQVRTVPQPRRAVLAQRPQTILPFQGLHVRQVHPDHWAPARHGGSGRAPAAAGQRKSGEFNRRAATATATAQSHGHRRAALERRAHHHNTVTNRYIIHATTAPHYQQA